MQLAPTGKLLQDSVNAKVESEPVDGSPVSCIVSGDVEPPAVTVAGSSLVVSASAAIVNAIDVTTDESAREVADMLTTAVEEEELGAKYSPNELSVPGPLNCAHVTPVLVPAFDTVALNCTVVPDATFCGIGVIWTDTAWVPLPMVSLSTDDMLAAKLVLPKYCAVMGCEPAVSDDVVTVATPPVSTLEPVPMGVGVPVLLSMKVTFPVGVPPVELELLTTAVMRTDAPTAAGFGEELSAMNVGVVVGTEMGFTVCVTTFDVLGKKFKLPAYTAVMEWDPTVSGVDVVNVACPLLTVPVPSSTPTLTPPSQNATFPAGVPPAGPSTTAMNVTDCPANEGFSEEARAVAEGRRFAGCTLAVWLPVLFAGFGSAVLALTVAVFVIVPWVVAVTTSVTVVLAPLAKLPKMQLIVAVPEQLPWSGVAETNVTPVGNTSVNTTPEASAGPLLVIVVVKVSLPPTATGSGAWIIATAKSAPTTVPLRTWKRMRPGTELFEFK